MWWLLFVSAIVGHLDSRLCHLGDHSWSRGKKIEQWAISGFFQMIIWVFPLWLLFMSPIVDYLSGSLVIRMITVDHGLKNLSSEQYQGTFKWLFKYFNSNLHVFIDLHVLIYQKVLNFLLLHGGHIVSDEGPGELSIFLYICYIRICWVCARCYS